MPIHQNFFFLSNMLVLTKLSSAKFLSWDPEDSGEGVGEGQKGEEGERDLYPGYRRTQESRYMSKL